MVGYALVRELPAITANVGGFVFAIVLVMHAPDKALEPMLAAIVPPVVTALARSKPADTIDMNRLNGSGGA